MKMLHVNRSICGSKFRFYLMITLAFLCTVTGCLPRQTIRQTSNEVISNKLDELYRIYLESDAEKAKQSMHSAVELLAESKLSKRACSNGLWLAFSRLHVLEAREGNAALAKAYLLKSQFWFLQNLELSGYSTEEALETVKSFTSDRCQEVIDSYDNKNTDGKGPHYMRK
jgi:hypothetical protein